jgi:hypothetical protein
MYLLCGWALGKVVDMSKIMVSPLYVPSSFLKHCSNIIRDGAVSVVIKDFHLLTCHSYPSYIQSLPAPFFVHRVDDIIREGL